MDLENFIRLNFALMQYHKYSLSDINDLIPWERDIYVELEATFRRRKGKATTNEWHLILKT